MELAKSWKIYSLTPLLIPISYKEAYENQGLTPMAYRAPECFNYKDWTMIGPNIKSDYWALGATSYHIIRGNPPFNGEGGLGQLVMMKSGGMTMSEVLDIDEFESDSFTNSFIKNALEINPSKRSLLNKLKRPFSIVQQDKTITEFHANNTEEIPRVQKLLIKKQLKYTIGIVIVLLTFFGLVSLKYMTSSENVNIGNANQSLSDSILYIDSSNIKLEDQNIIDSRGLPKEKSSQEVIPKKLPFVSQVRSRNEIK